MAKKTPRNQVIRPGSYSVTITTESGDVRNRVYGEHISYVESAQSAEDAYNQAKRELTPAHTIVKVVIVFLGAGLLLAAGPFAPVLAAVSLVLWLLLKRSKRKRD